MVLGGGGGGGGEAVDQDGNRIQSSHTFRHWGLSTMHQVPPVSRNITTLCLCRFAMHHNAMYYVVTLVGDGQVHFFIGIHV